jgi:hypothetical protein
LVVTLAHKVENTFSRYISQEIELAGFEIKRIKSYSFEDDLKPGGWRPP